MAFDYKIKFEPLKSKAFGSITGSYTTLGTPYQDPARMIKITNTTDVDILLSFDGTTDHDILPANTSQIYDFCSNRTTISNDLLVQIEGTQLYVKTSGSPSTGSVFLTVMYAD